MCYLWLSTIAASRGFEMQGLSLRAAIVPWVAISSPDGNQRFGARACSRFLNTVHTHISFFRELLRKLFEEGANVLKTHIRLLGSDSFVMCTTEPGI